MIQIIAVNSTRNRLYSNTCNSAIIISMKKHIRLILLILWMILIFYMSAQPQLESETTSNLVAELIYGIYAFIFPNNHLDVAVFLERYIHPIRKLAHFTEFMILGILVYLNSRDYTKKNNVFYSILFSVLYAVSDEIHQLFVDGRYCDIRDMGIDTAGALTGILLCHLLMTRCFKRKS